MSNVDEIIKLKELLDKDVITQEEFDKKKNELLNIKDNIVKRKTVNNNSKKSFFSKLGIKNNIALTSNKNNTKKKTRPSTIIAALIIVYLICTYVTNVDLTSNKYKSENLLATYNIPQENVDNIFSILDDIGYSTYYPDYKLEKSGDNEEIPGSIGFTINNGQQIIGFIDIKDNKVDNIQYSDKILYENGTIQHTLSEYVISDDEGTDLIVATQENIEKVLKSPSTAKFPWPDEWRMSKKDGSIIVQSYVDAQNSFGATTRSNFQVTYTNGIVTSLIFDGVEYIK